jgi:hypothetical protein
MSEIHAELVCIRLGNLSLLVNTLRFLQQFLGKNGCSLIKGILESVLLCHLLGTTNHTTAPINQLSTFQTYMQPPLLCSSTALLHRQLNNNISHLKCFARPMEFITSAACNFTVQYCTVQYSQTLPERQILWRMQVLPDFNIKSIYYIYE